MKKYILFILITILVISCGNGSSSSSSNTTRVCSIDSNSPAPSAESYIAQISAGGGYNCQGTNTPYVTVRVCPRETDSNSTQCQTIDHILLDTGSVGLKINASWISATNLTPLTNASNQQIYSCNLYGSGYVFAANYYADVYMGGTNNQGERALNIPIQIIDDSGSQSNVPSSCSNQGAFNNFTNSGAKGIIGVNPKLSVSNNPEVSNYKYVCNSTTCSRHDWKIISAESIPTTLNVNPLGSFANDNNGMIISYPTQESNTGNTIYGQLIFGLNTQSQNQYPTGEVSQIIKGLESSSIGLFNSSTSNKVFSALFDSGTNGWLFYDPSITQCNYDYYCPINPASWNSLAQSYNNSSQELITASIINPNYSYYALMPNIGWYMPNIGSSIVLYGLPFFLGKKVYVGFNSKTNPLGSGPNWSYQTIN